MTGATSFEKERIFFESKIRRNVAVVYIGYVFVKFLNDYAQKTAHRISDFFHPEQDKYLYFIPHGLKLCAISLHSMELNTTNFVPQMVSKIRHRYGRLSTKQGINYHLVGCAQPFKPNPC